MKKMIYTSPEIEIVEFSEEDILTASTNSWDDEGILGDDKNVTDWFN